MGHNANIFFLLVDLTIKKMSFFFSNTYIREFMLCSYKYEGNKNNKSFITK